MWPPGTTQSTYIHVHVRLVQGLGEGGGRYSKAGIRVPGFGDDSTRLRGGYMNDHQQLEVAVSSVAGTLPLGRQHGVVE